MRYRLNEHSGVVHDASARSTCDDAHHEGLTPLTYKAFILAVREGADPCDHCFRDDEIEAVIGPVADAGEEATDNA